MRISTGKCWLAATALVLGIANAEDTVQFDDEPFNRNSTFQLGQDPLTKVFPWESRNMWVDEVKLYTYDPSLKNASIELAYGTIQGQINPPNNPIDAGPPTPPDSSKTGQTATDSAAARLESTFQITPRIEGRADRGRMAGAKSDILAVSASSSNSGQVSLNLQDLHSISAYNWGMPLYFEAVWGSGLGRSYSRHFAVVREGEDDDTARAGGFATLIQSTDPYRPEIKPSDSEIKDSGSGTGTSSPNDQSLGSNPTVSDSNSGGLPKGAVIGIAVGAGIIGLIALFAFVWLVVRRQRRKQNLHHMDSYNSGSHADDLIAEKEARAGVDVRTPQSPYSDDGILAAAAALPPAAVSSTHLQQQQDPNQTFTPYTDRSSTALRQADEGRTSVVPSPIPGRSTPRDLTTPYAHLVEEGMTEDDVRRLEEEERQLDAAIEQARRR
ncbi:hypothetical protein QBC44DRAFT_378616 [Cladorrhinum sp. PSN332]|nr:hypothetical protein QBC44DRAFT_378616 [Cladorrhinum sp. PSN332]